MVRLNQPLPTLKDIEDAEGRIRKYIPTTPLERSLWLSEELGSDVYLKLENFHPIRVFKIRGALNKLQLLGDSALRRGVITASSGNHGLAVSYVARLFGVSATICVPTNANPQKVQGIQDHGAEVIRTGGGYDETLHEALALAEKRGLTFVHAFDDRDVIAGQGTCGLEMTRQTSDIDVAVVGVGGGGLISGIAIALKESLEHVRLFGAETYAIPSMYESLKAGKRVQVVPDRTIADGLQASIPGVLTFEACKRHLEKVWLVSDDAIEGAIFDLLVRSRLLVEPAGASPLAAFRTYGKGLSSGKVALVMSGGNISSKLLYEILKKRVL